MFQNRTISVIIPAGRKERIEALKNLLDNLNNGTLPPDEIIVADTSDSPAKARNIGVKKAKGDILVFVDDDAIPADSNVLHSVIEILISAESIGICGTSTDIPPNANCFQKAYRKQFPRTYFPVVRQVLDSDMATTLFCAIRRSDFEAIGGFDESLITGEDNFLRHKIRALGKRVVIAPQTLVYHPLPQNWKQLFRREIWYARGGAILAKKTDYPFEGRHIKNNFYAMLYILSALLLFPIRLFYGGPDNKSFGFWYLRAPAFIVKAFTYAWFARKGKK